MSDNGTNPFWQYSLALYSKPEVSEECLRFQNDYGGNVNLLLLCCWLGGQHVRLNAPLMAELNALVDFWDQQFICTLRELRKQLKYQYSGQLYQKLKDLELLAEKVLQDAFYQWFLQKKIAKALKPTIKINVQNYVSTLGAPRDGFSKLIGGANFC